MIYDPGGRMARRQIGFVRDYRFIPKEAEPKVDLVGVSQFNADDEQDGIESKGDINGKIDRKQARRATEK